VIRSHRPRLLARQERSQICHQARGQADGGVTGEQPGTADQKVRRLMRRSVDDYFLGSPLIGASNPCQATFVLGHQGHPGADHLARLKKFVRVDRAWHQRDDGDRGVA
jgi:hypothetical protein